MQKALHIFKRIKPPVAITISVIVFILILSTGAEAQEAVQTGFTMPGSNPSTGSTIAVGEMVWIAITLVFSFLLNLYLRRNEKRPEKITLSEQDEMVQQPVTIPVKQKAEAVQPIRLKRANKLAHKFAYQREHVMQPFTAVHYLTVSHKKSGVAS